MEGSAPHPFPESHTIVARLQNKLAERADQTYADWYRHNVKPTAPVRGVRMQDLRHLVMAWYQEWKLQYDRAADRQGFHSQLYEHHRCDVESAQFQQRQHQNQGQSHDTQGKTPPRLLLPHHTQAQTIQQYSTPPVSLQLEVTFLLFHAEFVDDRLAAMVFLDEVLIPNRIATPDLLPRLATLFPPSLISDFKACDHFAAKVLQPLLIRYGPQVSEHLRNWFSAESVWQARAALSALTPLASDAIYDELLFFGCSIVLARPEEEAKSIVGSALRALGKVRPGLVEEFLSQGSNLIHTNAHCLNKATQVLDSQRQMYFREQRRLLLTWNAQAGIPSGTNTPPSSASMISVPGQGQVPYKAPSNIFRSAQSGPVQTGRPISSFTESALLRRSIQNTETAELPALDIQAGIGSPSDRISVPDIRSTGGFTDMSNPCHMRERSISSSLVLPLLHTIEPPVLSGTSEDRNSFLSGVARGRITRSESGLRRRFRRSRSQSTSSTPSPGVPTLLSSEGTMTGRHEEPQESQTKQVPGDNEDHNV